MAILSQQDYETFEALRLHALQIFDERPTTDPGVAAVEMMKREDVPMHYPFHHFIVPASLIIAASVSKNISRDRVEDMLLQAMERAVNVIGGFCGEYGACGAGVGAGIFMSVFTDSSPMSVKTWGWCNEITGVCLQAIAKYDGPRCCKRTAFLSFAAAVPYANEKLGTAMTVNENQICDFYEMNRECKKKKCPFYPL